MGEQRIGERARRDTRVLTSRGKVAVHYAERPDLGRRGLHPRHKLDQRRNSLPAMARSAWFQKVKVTPLISDPP